MASTSPSDGVHGVWMDEYREMRGYRMPSLRATVATLLATSLLHIIVQLSFVAEPGCTRILWRTSRVDWIPNRICHKVYVRLTGVSAVVKFFRCRLFLVQ